MNWKIFIKSCSVEILIIWIFLGFSSCTGQTGNNNGPQQLQDYSRIDKAARNEVSGIIKSRKYENVFWVHGDSGNNPNIFPINKQGEIASNNHSNGVKLTGIDNEDWEDIALDDAGNLIVADIGNNCLCRDDLALLIFPEPELDQREQTEYQNIRIRYPEATEKQQFFGIDENRSPDAEAVFFKNGVLYLITKEKDGDAKDGEDTELYKLESWEESAINTLTLVSTYDFDDKVTASDLSFNGDSLAVLTRSSIWLFSDFEGDDFFAGSSKRIMFKAEQVESVAFSGDESLIIAEETGQLYEIPISDFK